MHWVWFDNKFDKAIRLLYDLDAVGRTGRREGDARFMELIFYGGVNEIGGNKILLRVQDTQVLFDFGQSFTMGRDYFVHWLIPRPQYGVRDYFEFELLPRISGLYREADLAYTDLPYVFPRIAGVFLSHAHFDHVGHLRFIDAQVPVYCGSGTRLFLASAEESSPAMFGDHAYRTFRTGDTIDLGAVVVEPIHVDHSIPSAYGFLIHTPTGVLVYTGDLRAHGPKHVMTDEFIARAAECAPVALITEGTRMVADERRVNYSEAEVKARCQDIVATTEKLVLVTMYGRDMDRFRTLYEVAVANDRQMVISTRKAYLLAKLVQDERLDLPDPRTDPHIRVYFRRKASGTYAESDYYLWERLFLEKMVTGADVRARQGAVVMDLGFYQLAELIDIQPEPGSHFIHSMSEPFSEEDLEDVVLHNWLAHFDIQFHQLHASGHLSRDELTAMVDQINPQTVYPIHTEHPGLFKTRFPNTQLVQSAKPYRL